MSLEVYIHASEIYTGAGVRSKYGRKPVESDLGIIADGAIVVEKGKILWVGATDELPSKYKPTVDLKLERGIMPGLIDSHTHLVFAGDRATEFARRCGGESYQKIAAEGGGIQTSVKATREATETELIKLGSQRIQEAYSRGTRTLEIKSGYGLSLETELKILRVIKHLRAAHPEVTLISTFLGAHDFPRDVQHEEYIRSIIEEQIPAVVKENLATFCDVFIDEGFYTLSEGEKILSAAAKLGLKTKVHADELSNTEAASLAVRLSCHSADHLLKVSPRGITALAQSNTVATLLPGTAFYLKAPHAPARALIDAGARVCLATDFNPGTCMTLNLPAILTLGALYLGMTRAELFASVTYNAACALGLSANKGTLEAGKDADLWIMPFARFEESYYRFAW